MPKRRYNITALAYDKRGRLLSVGKNSYIKTHPLQAKFARKAGEPHKTYLHAELDALLKAPVKPYKLVITRFDSKGRPKPACPCATCQEAIKHFGVKIVEHT